MILCQPKDGYCYNSDTLFLYDFITNFNIKKKVLEVGGGCGVLGSLVARDFKIELSVVEIQKVMSDFILKNSQKNSIPLNLNLIIFLFFILSSFFAFIASLK